MNNRKFAWFSLLRGHLIYSALIICLMLPLPTLAKKAESSARPRNPAVSAKPAAKQSVRAKPIAKQMPTKKKAEPQKPSGNDYLNVVQIHLGEIQQCYDQQLKSGTNGSGKLVVRWMIDSTGRSSQFTQEKNDLNSNEFFNCAVQAIERWNFPKERSIQFRYTFNLTQQDREVARTFKPDNTSFQKSSKSTKIDF